MPYNEVDLDCNILLCANNEEGSCNCDIHVNSLNPDKFDCFHFQFNPGCFDVTIHQTSIEDMLEMIEQENIPFISLDKESPKFQTVMATNGDYCVIQGSDEDIKQYNFWKHVDGGFGYSHKDQLELFSKES